MGIYLKFMQLKQLRLALEHISHDFDETEVILQTFSDNKFHYDLLVYTAVTEKMDGIVLGGNDAALELSKQGKLDITKNTL